MASNVRELENLVQHMSILFSGKKVNLSDLPEKFHSVEIPEKESVSSCSPDSPASAGPVDNEKPILTRLDWENGQVNFKELINDFETQLIVEAMKKTDGNKKEAARLLNLKRTTLLEKIKKKKISGLWEKD
jgi:DNA-binding NtrC family response regulator